MAERGAVHGCAWCVIWYLSAEGQAQDAGALQEEILLLMSRAVESVKSNLIALLKRARSGFSQHL